MRLFGLNDVTAEQVKEYADVSAYRNILDMLNTLDGTLKAAANYLYNKARLLVAAEGGEASGKKINGAIGYANAKWPELKQRKGGADFAHYYYAVKLLREHLGFPAYWELSNFPSLRKPAAFDAYDLLNLARQIEWEMNRVRLPVPHNFRQLSSWINRYADFDFQVKNANRVGQHIEAGPNGKQIINYYEMIRIIRDELRAVKEMRQEIRKEIDAAKLSPQVQEETLRREQEALISRDQAASQAEDREAAIRAEKAADYRADYDALIVRLKAASSQAEQLRVLGQLETVVAAINSLVADSAGQVRVPAVDLLPSAAELQQVAQQIVIETVQERQDIAGQVEQAVAAHDDLVNAATAAQTDQEASVLVSQAAALEREIKKMQADLAVLDSRQLAARAATQAAAAGDVPAAVAELQATNVGSKLSAVAPLVGLILLALNS